MILTELGHVEEEEKGEGREGAKCSSQECKDTKGVGNQNGWTVQGRVNGEGQPSSWTKVWGRDWGMTTIPCDK